MKKRILSLLFASCLVVGLLPVIASAAEETGGFTVTGGTLNTDYTYADGVLTVKTATNLTIKNTDPNTATTDRIVVELTDSSATADITLAGVNIAENNQNNHLVTIRSSANIALSDKNTLTGDGSTTSYGIYIYSSAQDIAVSIGGNGTLASSGSWASINNNGETLSINDGTIIATGSYRGIDSSGVLNISGGNVDASGDYGIYNDGGNIGISGGAVAATGATYAIYNAGEGWAFNLTNHATLAITGGYLSVSRGGTFTIGNGSKLTIENGARLTVAGSTSKINAGLLTNEGTIDCAGAIALAAGTSTDGSLDPIGTQVETLKKNRYPYTGGQIWNKGALNIQSGGVLNINQGAITTFTNGLNNQGCFGGRLYSTGTVTVAGTAIVGGTADEAGARTAQGSITLEGKSLTVADGGVLTVNGEVGSYRAGTKATSLNNSGAVTVVGTLQMVDAGDTVTNTGTITVEENGQLNFTHPGTANTNSNVFTNSGTISIESGGKLDISGVNATLNNNGELIVDAGGAITNDGSISNGTDSNNPDATMELNGTLTNNKQFTIQNISGLTGSGSIVKNNSAATFVCNEPAVVVPENLTYTGEAHTIELSDEVEFNGVEFTVQNQATNWKASYTLDGELATVVKDAGDYEVTFENNTNTSLTFSATFTVTPKTVENPTITVTDAGTYDGTEKKPTVTVEDGDITIADSEYAVSYTDNVNAGTATVTISYASGGNYIVNGSTTFSIAPKTVSNPTITVADAGIYDGTEKKPTVTVKDGNTTIGATEYTVSFTNNINAGTSTAIVTITDAAAGNYIVNGSEMFSIGKATYDPGTTFPSLSAKAGDSVSLDLSSYCIEPGITTPVVGTIEDNQSIIEKAAVENGVLTVKIKDDVSGIKTAYVTVNFTNGKNYDNYNIKFTVSSSDKAVPVISAENITATYNGSAITADAITGTATYNGTNVQGKWSFWTYPAPTIVNVGTYADILVCFDPTDQNTYGSVQDIITITVNKATITITADNKTVYVGDAAPALTYTVEGLAESESLKTLPTIAYEGGDPDMSRAGETVITVSGAEVPNGGNYNDEITYVNGVLTVETKSTGGGTYIPTYYTLTFNVDGGSAVDSIRKVSGSTIDLSDYVPTREGYTFNGWYYDEALTTAITSVRLTKNTTVYAGWTKNAEPIVNPFKDIYETDWYYNDVMYVYGEGLMEGTAVDLFSPNVIMTRGMIVTILYRLEGEPNVDALANPFTDLTQSWYVDAVKWAAEHEIVIGYGNGKYGPEDSLTREQMVTILWRYAKYKGVDVSAGESTNILGFNDAAEVSEYAISAMQWACAEGIIYGDGVNLTPKASAPRSQFAAILHRYCELIAE